MKTRILALLITLVIGMSFTVWAANDDPNENPGDIVTNPWGDLFTETVTTAGDLPLDTTASTTAGGETQVTGVTTAPSTETTALVEKTTAMSDPSIDTSLGKVKIKKVFKKKKSAKKITLKVKKVRGAKGYQVAVYKSKKLAKKNKKPLVKKWVKKNKAKLVIKSKKLKNKKKLFVKVRAYKKVNGVVSFGFWSQIKKIK